MIPVSVKMAENVLEFKAKPENINRKISIDLEIIGNCQRKYLSV